MKKNNKSSNKKNISNYLFILISLFLIFTFSYITISNKSVKSILSNIVGDNNVLEKEGTNTCTYKQKTFKDGDKFSIDCNTCTCDKGNIICTDLECGDTSEDNQIIEDKTDQIEKTKDSEDSLENTPDSKNNSENNSRTNDSDSKNEEKIENTDLSEESSSQTDELQKYSSLNGTWTLKDYDWRGNIIGTTQVEISLNGNKVTIMENNQKLCSGILTDKYTFPHSGSSAKAKNVDPNITPFIKSCDFHDLAIDLIYVYDFQYMKTHMPLCESNLPSVFTRD